MFELATTGHRQQKFRQRAEVIGQFKKVKKKKLPTFLSLNPLSRASLPAAFSFHSSTSLFWLFLLCIYQREIANSSFFPV